MAGRKRDYYPPDSILSFCKEARSYHSFVIILRCFFWMEIPLMVLLRRHLAHKQFAVRIIGLLFTCLKYAFTVVILRRSCLSCAYLFVLRDFHCLYLLPPAVPLLVEVSQSWMSLLAVCRNIGLADPIIVHAVNDNASLRLISLLMRPRRRKGKI